MSLLECFPKWSPWLAGRPPLLTTAPAGEPVQLLGRPGKLGTVALSASVPVSVPDEAAFPLVLRCTAPHHPRVDRNPRTLPATTIYECRGFGRVCTFRREL